MKVILVNYRYMPEDYPNALRWAPIAEYWVEQGHSVDVVCAMKPGLARYEVVNGVRVHRVGGRLLEFLRRKLRASEKPPSSAGGEPVANGRAGAAWSPIQFSKWLHDRTWKKLYWPDYAFLWYPPAITKVKRLLDEGHYDGLVSISHPFTAHLVGLHAKKRNPELSWTVDLGDPFSFVEDTPANNRRLYKSLNFYAEGRIFDSADAIAVTPQAEQKYAEVFPESGKKMHAVPLPLPSVEIGNGGEPVFPDDGRTRLVFIGSLYRRIRNPKSLLELFAMLLRRWQPESLELHFFGNIGDCWDYFEPYKELLGTSIFVHGVVPRYKALQAVSEADLVVNIANDTPYQLPSKVMEYASLGKRVLNLSQIENDSSAKFFDSYPTALNLKTNVLSMSAEQCDDLIRFLENSPFQADPSKLQHWLAPYQVESVAETYEELLERAVDAPEQGIP